MYESEKQAWFIFKIPLSIYLLIVVWKEINFAFNLFILFLQKNYNEEDAW